MSDKELVHKIVDNFDCSCQFCAFHNKGCVKLGSCYEGVRKWFNSEVE